MPQSLLKDGRTVDNSTIVDFDETHTNCVDALTDEERIEFVERAIPDPIVVPPPEPTPTEKLESIGLTDAATIAALKSLLGLK